MLLILKALQCLLGLYNCSYHLVSFIFYQCILLELWYSVPLCWYWHFVCYHASPFIWTICLLVLFDSIFNIVLAQVPLDTCTCAQYVWKKILVMFSNGHVKYHGYIVTILPYITHYLSLDFLCLTLSLILERITSTVSKFDLTHLPQKLNLDITWWKYTFLLV